MKLIRTLALIPLVMFTQNTEAQFFKKLKKRAERAAEETIHRKAEQKTAQKTEEVMDSIFDAPKKVSKKDKRQPSEKNGQNGNTEIYKGDDDASATRSSTVFSAYSKFDFEAGEKIIAYEDFASDEIGDLPARWNSSNSAEVVTLSTMNGKWLKIGKGKGSFVPDFITEFPENFTLEYDVIFDYDVSLYIFLRFFVMNFSDLENPNYQMDRYGPGKNGAYFRIDGGISSGGEVSFHKYAEERELNISSKKKVPQLARDNSGRGKIMHVSVWRQGKRLRVYLDETKVFDIPRAFEEVSKVKSMRFFSEISDDDNYYFLGNIRYAVGKADTRSKLLNEGKLVTYGITFDSGSDKLRPESYGVLKKIASVIKENNVSVKIIGHTDGDGDRESNQKLSESRATSVKKALVSEFGVDNSSLNAEGRGESEPIADNNSSEGKAKNRRVEFIKL